MPLNDGEIFRQPRLARATRSDLRRAPHDVSATLLLSQKRCGRNSVKRPRPDFHADSRAGTQSRSIQSIRIAASFTASETLSSVAIFSSSRAIRSAASSMRCLALALTAGALPPWCVQTRPP